MRLKKAHYYSVLKKAAELDEEEARIAEPSSVSKVVSLTVGLAIALASSLGLKKLSDKIVFSKLAEKISSLTEKMMDEGFHPDRMRDPYEVLTDSAEAYEEEILKTRKLNFSLKSMRAVMTVGIVVFSIAGAVTINRLNAERIQKGMSWVDFIKYVFKREKSKLMRLFNRILNRPSSKDIQVIENSIKSDGSLDKSALKFFLTQNFFD